VHQKITLEFCERSDIFKGYMFRFFSEAQTVQPLAVRRNATFPASAKYSTGNEKTAYLKKSEGASNIANAYIHFNGESIGYIIF
jgi:hypothetical protein